MHTASQSVTVILVVTWALTAIAAVQAMGP